jgi:hypothetical protein
MRSLYAKFNILFEALEKQQVNREQILNKFGGGRPTVSTYSEPWIEIIQQWRSQL